MQNIIDTLNGLNVWSIAFRVLLAAICGGAVGSERDRHGRAAGLRTHILVCLGAAMTTMLGLYVHTVLHFNNDPLRMGAQVVSGIGFLGAGTIIVRNHSHVTGLSTAAGLWATASIGLAIGAGFYWAALLAMVIVLVTFSMLTRMGRFSRHKKSGIYYIELPSIEKAQHFYKCVEELVTEVDILPAKSGLSGHVGLEFLVMGKENDRALQKEMTTCGDIVIAVPVHQ